MSRKTGAPSSTSPWKGRAIANGWQLAPVTSPLEGEVGSRALRASREGGRRPAQSNKYPPPHPSPSSKSDVSDLDQSSMAELGNTRVRLGEGGNWGWRRVRCARPCSLLLLLTAKAPSVPGG